MNTTFHLTTVSLTFLFATGVSSAAIIADLRGNYDASTRSNGVAANIADTQGTGRWTFDARNTATVAPSRTTQLLYSTSANSVRNANAYVLPGQTLDLPAISNTQLIAGSGEGAPASNQLALHTGQQASALPFLGIRWTPGLAEYGSATISGTFQDIGAVGDGVSILILNQAGTSLYGNISIGQLTSFNFSTTLASGSFIDFIFGTNGNYNSDHSALSISIDGVPEPTAAALLALGSLCLLRRKRA